MPDTYTSPEKKSTESILKSLNNIAVVGNGEIKDKGKEIDSHDVIRLNNFKIKGFEKDVGEKVSAWCHSCFIFEDKRSPIYEDSIKPRDLNVPAFIVNHPDYQLCANPVRIAEWLNKYPDTILPERDYEAEISMPNEVSELTGLAVLAPKRPSTGLLLLYILNELEIPTDIYGFDSFETGHYWELNKELTTHSKFEKDLIDKMKFITRK